MPPVFGMMNRLANVSDNGTAEVAVKARTALPMSNVADRSKGWLVMRSRGPADARPSRLIFAAAWFK